MDDMKKPDAPETKERNVHWFGVMGILENNPPADFSTEENNE